MTTPTVLRCTKTTHMYTSFSTSAVPNTQMRTQVLIRAPGAGGMTAVTPPSPTCRSILVRSRAMEQPVGQKQGVFEETFLHAPRWERIRDKGPGVWVYVDRKNHYNLEPYELDASASLDMGGRLENLKREVGHGSPSQRLPVTGWSARDS